MAITTSLVSYWKLDEASGNALDAHGSNDLNDEGPGTTTGKINNCRQFVPNQRFSHLHNSDLAIGDIDFTLACWFQAHSTPGGTVFNLADKYSGATGKGYELGYVGFGLNDIAFALYDGSQIGRASAGTISLDTWYYVVAWHDAAANTVNIQLNNGSVTTVSTSAPAADSGGKFGLGGRTSDNTLFWDGLIDEAGFWKRVLTSDERTALYNGGNGLAYPFVTDVVAQPAAGSIAASGLAPSLAFVDYTPLGAKIIFRHAA